MGQDRGVASSAELCRGGSGAFLDFNLRETNICFCRPAGAAKAEILKWHLFQEENEIYFLLFLPVSTTKINGHYRSNKHKEILRVG